MNDHPEGPPGKTTAMRDTVFPSVRARLFLLLFGGFVAMVLFQSVYSNTGLTFRGEVALILGAGAAFLAAFTLSKGMRQFRCLEGDLDTVLNCVPAAIWYKDTENNFIRVNKAAADLAGLGGEEIQGRPAVEIFPLDAEASYRDDLEVLFSGKPKLGIVERATSRSGVERWVRADKLPIRDDTGKITGILVVAIDVTDLRQTQQALLKSEDRQRFLSAKLLSVCEEERKSIARELHDSIGSSLTAIKMSLEKAEAEFAESGHGPEMLGPAIEWTQLAINEIRRLTSDLRPTVLDDMGVLAALQWFFRQYRTTYPAIHVEAQISIGEQDIPQSLKIVIFRITQEAFHNIGKHSGAEFVEFFLGKQDGAIKLRVEDNGEGFECEAVQEGQGIGLVSMKERAELSGGSFCIRSLPGTGTIVSARWPADIPANSFPR
jgi:PAS domain S-box-containing protein